MFKIFYKITAALLVLLGCCCYFFSQVADNTKCIPLLYSDLNIPCIQGMIQKTPIVLEIDTGSPLGIQLNDSKLEILEKTYQGVSTIGDIFGNKYEIDKYKLSDFIVEPFSMNKVTVRSLEKKDPENDTINIEKGLSFPLKNKKISSYDGMVGRRLLRKHNILFDTANSKLYFVPTFEQAVKKGLISKNALKYYLSDNGKKHIILDVDVNNVPLHFVLDSGASHSMISSECFTTNRPKQGKLWKASSFKIQGKEFNSRTLIVLDMAKNLPCKGVLGMDFFHEHKIYIDWKKQALFID